MKKSTSFTVAGGVCCIIVWIFAGLLVITEPTLTHEEKFLWFTLWTYKTLNPTFYALSVLGMISGVLGLTFLVLGIIFAYLERKESTYEGGIIFCRYCGTRNTKEAIFCKECGKKMGEEPP